jgi:hypothetical protein
MGKRLTDQQARELASTEGPSRIRLWRLPLRHGKR